MNITKVRGETILSRDAEKPKSVIAIRLMWIPGIRPVIVPAHTPRRTAIIMFIIIMQRNSYAFINNTCIFPKIFRLE